MRLLGAPPPEFDDVASCWIEDVLGALGVEDVTSQRPPRERRERRPAREGEVPLMQVLAGTPREFDDVTTVTNATIAKVRDVEHVLGALGIEDVTSQNVRCEWREWRPAQQSEIPETWILLARPPELVDMFV